MDPSAPVIKGNPQPLRRGWRSLSISSGVIILLLTGVSLAGLLYRDQIYATEELAQAFMANDLVNLIIAIPILLLCLWFTHRRKLMALLMWPGALFYVVYNCIAYVMALPIGWVFLANVIALSMSVYSMIALVASIDTGMVRKRIADQVPVRLAAGVLMAFGALFLLLAAVELVSAILGRSPLTEPEVAVRIADLLTSPAYVIGGLMLWQRRDLGYAGGLALLFQACMLFVGLIFWMVLAPVMTGAAFVFIDFIIIILFSLVCFVPFGLYVRSVVRS